MGLLASVITAGSQSGVTRSRKPCGFLSKFGLATVQGILRHSKIQTTLDLYTQEDSDEARGAQGTFLKAVGMHSGMVQ